MNKIINAAADRRSNLAGLAPTKQACTPVATHHTNDKFFAIRDAGSVPGRAAARLRAQRPLGADPDHLLGPAQGGAKPWRSLRPIVAIALNLL